MNTSTLAGVITLAIIIGIRIMDNFTAQTPIANDNLLIPILYFVIHTNLTVCKGE